MIGAEALTVAQMNFPGIVAIRTCTGCGQGKGLTVANFYCHKTNRAGFDTRCRDCRNATRRVWRAANADKINARRRELYALKKSKIPEPSAGDVPAAGETTAVSASALPSPALLALGEPASVEGAAAGMSQHAPPAFNSPVMASEKVGGVAGACSALSCGENRTGTESETSGDGVERHAPNPMDRSTTDTGVGKHGGTSTAEHDGPPTGQAGGPSTSSKDDFPDIPDFLRRTREPAE